MKILLTGSAGFIFSNFVIYALQRTDWDMVSVDKLTYAGSLHNVPYNRIKRHRLHIGDVCDHHFMHKIFEMEEPDVVIHAAAESHVDNSIESSAQFMKTNVIGTHSMLEAALTAHKPELFINFSTDEVYGPCMDRKPFTEKDMLNPRNPYSASKASADLLGQSYFTTHKVPVITTRMCNAFGPRQHREKLIPKVISNIFTEQPVPVYGKGEQCREWIYTRDVFNAVRTLIEKGVPGEVYNITSGHEERNIDLVNKIADIIGTGKSLITFVKDRKAHDFRYAIDDSKIRSLGWEPEYEFDAALEHTVGWMRANQWSWKECKSG